MASRVLTDAVISSRLNKLKPVLGVREKKRRPCINQEPARGQTAATTGAQSSLSLSLALFSLFIIECERCFVLLAVYTPSKFGMRPVKHEKKEASPSDEDRHRPAAPSKGTYKQTISLLFVCYIMRDCLFFIRSDWQRP